MERSPVTITQTVLTFVAIPVAIVAVIAGLAYASGGRHRGRRYRPGRPFEFAPVWFVSAPERLSVEAGAAELTIGPHREAMASAPRLRPTGEAGKGEQALQGSTGGASDRW